MPPQGESRNYAHLPDELLGKILESVPNTVDKMNGLFDIQDEPIAKGMEKLRAAGKIKKLSDVEPSHSLIAVDGGNIPEKLAGADVLLAVAVGVEGLSEDKDTAWGADKNQYYQWQTVLPHGEANARLIQGVMFLMELSVLANDDHEIRIMDGTHFTPILKINSMLSAKEEGAGPEYAAALRDFLRETYSKIIPDIPDIITAAQNNEHIIALAKYSSSTDIIDAFLSDCEIKLDDKTFFSLGLAEDEYLVPHSVGQSKQEREKIWNELHIACSLDIPEKDALNTALKNAIAPITTKGGKESELYYTYYRPYMDGPAYRVELKKAVATDSAKLERYLGSLKKQIIFPEIREPYPQYLVDLMAKSISTGMFAIIDAIRLSPDLKIDQGKFGLLFSYRT
ncbi:MAG TPA: DNA double-strand break repair nuclease NurA [Candidatus Paceibacterota bacterium]|nr:DNA double-strand break repair nuclease NurA [Candidatus Paceibacterota bacterium]